MSTNGHNTYDLTEALERWDTYDLINFLLDSETMLGLEKYQIVLLAQECAERLEIELAADEDAEYDDEDDEDEPGSREYND